jgi:hypothetical protein
MSYHSQVVIYEHKQQFKIRKLEEFFGDSIENIILNYELPVYMIYIMNGDERALQTRYENIYKSVLSCVHASDARTPLQYAKDIVMAWIFETYIMRNLQKCGLQLVRNGGDKDYQFLQGANISSDSDFMLGNQRVELICNYTDYWTKHNCIDLRENKAKHLYQFNTLVLGFTLEEDYCLVIDFSKYLPNEYIPDYPAFGGKPAHRIMITTDMKVPMNFNAVAQRITDIIQRQDNTTSLLDFGFQEHLHCFYLKCDACKAPLLYKDVRPDLKECPKCKKLFAKCIQVYKNT